MIYNSPLPPAVILTWIQLRGLAWDGKVTPPLRVHELSVLTGKGRATLYNHLSLLRSKSALSWHNTEQGMMIVSFADNPSKIMDIEEFSSSIPESRNLESGILESGNPDCLPSLKNPESLCLPLIKPENQESKQIITEAGIIKGGGREFEGRMGDKKVQTFKPSNVPMIYSEAVSAYRSLVQLTPRPAQRRILDAKITDLHLWQLTLEHWITHGWNPRNLVGMLELYDRGGPPGCYSCHSERRSKPQAKTAHQKTLEALDSLSKKLDQPPHSA